VFNLQGGYPADNAVQSMVAGNYDFDVDVRPKI
jgi:hypothetical protein